MKAWEEFDPADAPASYSDGEKAAYAHGWNKCLAVITEHLDNLFGNKEQGDVDVPTAVSDPEPAPEPEEPSNQANGEAAAFDAGIHTQEPNS